MTDEKKSLEIRRLYKEAHRLLDRILFTLQENERILMESGHWPEYTSQAA